MTTPPNLPKWIEEIQGRLEAVRGCGHNRYSNVVPSFQSDDASDELRDLLRNARVDIGNLIDEVIRLRAQVKSPAEFPQEMPETDNKRKATR